MIVCTVRIQLKLCVYTSKIGIRNDQSSIHSYSALFVVIVYVCRLLCPGKMVLSQLIMFHLVHMLLKWPILIMLMSQFELKSILRESTELEE